MLLHQITKNEQVPLDKGAGPCVCPGGHLDPVIEIGGAGGEIPYKTHFLPPVLSRLPCLWLFVLPVKIPVFLLILASVKPMGNCQQPFAQAPGDHICFRLFLVVPAPA